MIANGRIVSGASTLTMQVARLLEPRAERSFIAKLRQLVRAVQLERTLSKGEILELYLNSIYLGRNAWGVEMAARSYFNKSAKELTLAEGDRVARTCMLARIRRKYRCP